MLAVTIDIEDWYHLSPITGTPSSKFKDVEHFFSEWNEPYDYLTEPTKRVLELLEGLNIRATFFIVADVVENYHGLVEQIAKEGHEIACHGLHHACKIHPKTKKPLMSIEEFKERTLKAKKILEDAAGQEVVGYRAPNGYIAGWMLDALEDMGFRYDSSVSLNSFYNKMDSTLKGVDTRAYYPERGSLQAGKDRRGIIEMPFPHLAIGGLKFPTQGGPLLRFLGVTYTMLGLKQSLKKGHAIFYFHPIDISRENFPLNSSLKQKLFWAIKGDIVEQRIKHILTCIDTEMGTCRDLASHFAQAKPAEIKETI